MQLAEMGLPESVQLRIPLHKDGEAVDMQAVLAEIRKFADTLEAELDPGTPAHKQAAPGVSWQARQPRRSPDR